MDLLIWDDKYSVKVAEIDAQHKKMFEMINHLFHTLEESKAQQELQPIIKGFVDYAAYHFSTEEKYFNQFNYPGKEEHIQAHRVYTQKIQEFLSNSATDWMSVSVQLMDYVEDWWIQHVTGKDQQYSKFFNDHGLH